MTVNSYGDNAFNPGMISDAYVPDQLIAGDLKIVTDNVTIASGAGVVVRGSVLGKITASGKYIVSATAAVDGSQNPVAILADTVDATAADHVAGVYIQAEVNGNALTLGAGWTVTTIKAALQPLSLYVKTPVSAADPS